MVFGHATPDGIRNLLPHASTAPAAVPQERIRAASSFWDRAPISSSSSSRARRIFELFSWFTRTVSSRCISSGERPAGAEPPERISSSKSPALEPPPEDTGSAAIEGATSATRFTTVLPLHLTTPEAVAPARLWAASLPLCRVGSVTLHERIAELGGELTARIAAGAVLLAGFRILDAKVWGVALMGLSTLIFFFLPWLDRSPVKSIRYKGPLFKAALTIFVVVFLVLI